MLEKINFKQTIIGTGLVSFALTILFSGGDDLKWNSIALGGLMVLFWLFEVVPIYVTALMPFVFGIPLGVLDAQDLTNAYGHKYIYLFFGGFVLSLALEKWGVHKQIAERIINIVGTSKARILLGFLLSTALLSMWISNTATALMMLPMATAVIANMSDSKKSKFPIYLLLAVAYGASVGGMATLVGSPPNLQMAGTLSSVYHINISFVDWMKVGLPVSLVILFAVFGIFYLLLGKERKVDVEELQTERMKWDPNQIRVLLIFLGVVILWAFREPINHWTNLGYTDQGVAVFGAVLLFFIPSTREKKALLDWKDTQKLSWGILILFGGGMALANMLKKNGVIDELSKVFHDFADQPLFILLLVMITIAIFGTELMSNLALVSVFVPIIASFALDSDLPVLQLCMPVTLASSCAFMLPVGTPPNAIVFSSGQLHINQMARVGFVLNIVSVIIVTIMAVILL